MREYNFLYLNTYKTVNCFQVTPVFSIFFTAAIFLKFQTYFDKICFELKIQTLHFICKGDDGLSYRTTSIFLTFSIYRVEQFEK